MSFLYRSDALILQTVCLHLSLCYSNKSQWFAAFSELRVRVLLPRSEYHLDILDILDILELCHESWNCYHAEFNCCILELLGTDCRGKPIWKKIIGDNGTIMASSCGMTMADFIGPYGEHALNWLSQYTTCTNPGSITVKCQSNFPFSTIRFPDLYFYPHLVDTSWDQKLHFISNRDRPTSFPYWQCKHVQVIALLAIRQDPFGWSYKK